jgi:pimeloyl-ACP methyl ester carboxylesterase
MKKTYMLSLSLLVTCITVFAQNDFEKMEQGFAKMMNDPKNIYGKNKAAGKYYNVRGIKMYAEVYGKGAPLLFIHGNGGSCNNFFKQVPYFSKKYKVIIADSRAQGKSVDTGDSLTYEMMADDYAALLDAMKIDSAYVIGWSDGGINALLLAIRHPGKVKKLAATGANLRPDSSAIPQELINMLSGPYNELKNKTGKNAEEQGAYKLVRLLLEQPNIPDADLKKITCPALIIGGDHDVIKEEHTMEIYKNISRAYLWILPNSGHSTPIFFSDEFNKKIDDFFSKPYRTFDKTQRLF